MHRHWIYAFFLGEMRVTDYRDVVNSPPQPAGVIRINPDFPAVSCTKNPPNRKSQKEKHIYVLHKAGLKLKFKISQDMGSGEVPRTMAGVRQLGKRINGTLNGLGHISRRLR